MALCPPLDTPVICRVYFICEVVISMDPLYPTLLYFIDKAILQFRAKIQQTKDTYLSVENFKQLSSVTSFISLTNDLSSSYNFSATNVSQGRNVKVWDLGSAECDSIDSSLCVRFLNPPSSGCGGAGCGVGEWQSLSGECERQPNAHYDISERKGRSFVWPISVFNEYYSYCKLPVRILEKKANDLHYEEAPLIHNCR